MTRRKGEKNFFAPLLLSHSVLKKVTNLLFLPGMFFQHISFFSLLRGRRLIVLLLGLGLLKVSPLWGQNPHVYSQYFMNPYVYNAAMAGVEGHNAVFLMYRQQWQGLEGAPRVSHLNWHTPLKHATSIGVMLSNEQIGPLTNNAFKFTLAYLMSVDKTHFFRFGLSLGAAQQGLDIGKIIGNGALSARYATELTNYRPQSFHFLADFGMMYHFGRFNLGVSFPELLGRSTLNTGWVSPVRGLPIERIFFKANYRRSLFDDAIALEPHFLYRYDYAGSNQYEASMVVHIAHFAWVGVSYRQNAGLIGLLGFKVNTYLGFGYAYDLTMGDFAQYAGGTHEIHVGLHIGQRYGHVEHVTSFIKSQKEAHEDSFFDTLLIEEDEFVPQDGFSDDYESGLVDKAADPSTSPPTFGENAADPSTSPPTFGENAADPSTSPPTFGENALDPSAFSPHFWRKCSRSDPFSSHFWRECG